MNVQNSKDYLEQIMPSFTITVIEGYKGKKNNRYEFSKAGYEKPAAVLLAQNLEPSKNMLDDLAVAVNKKFNEAPPEIAEQLTPEATTEEPKRMRETTSTIYNNPIATASDIISRDLYEAAKRVVEIYEMENTVT